MYSRIDVGVGGGDRFSLQARHWAKSYECGAGDRLIGLNITAPIFWDPGPIFEFFMPNPSVWYRFQPNIVSFHCYLPGGQDRTVSSIVTVLSQFCGAEVRGNVRMRGGDIYSIFTKTFKASNSSNTSY